MYNYRICSKYRSLQVADCVIFVDYVYNIIRECYCVKGYFIYICAAKLIAVCDSMLKNISNSLTMCLHDNLSKQDCINRSFSYDIFMTLRSTRKRS